MIAKFFAALLFADFLSGFFHWWEDRYGNPEWPILGPLIVLPNIEHHEHPGRMCGSTYLARNATTIVPCAIACWLALWLACDFLVWSFALLSQANELHCWAHQRCSYPVRVLQKMGLLQSPRAHANHHRKPFDTNFCVMTSFVNSILEACKFWSRVESLLALVGIRTRQERLAG